MFLVYCFLFMVALTAYPSENKKQSEIQLEF
jgi:hypothetical protein